MRTGKQLWTFHSIPQKGEFGNETWDDDSWTYTGNTNVWTNMTADEELGYVYLPFGTPTNDFYGGHRPGANLFAETLVALDAKTGKRVWHFQGVHHGMWDYDFPARRSWPTSPSTASRSRRVAQVSKQGFTYVFDRTHRRAGVADRGAAGAAIDRAGRADVADAAVPDQAAGVRAAGRHRERSDRLHAGAQAAALEVFKQFDTGPLFTPPSEKGTIVNPGWAGGANWAGASFDPETGMLYVPSMTSPIVVQLVKPNAERSNLLYARGGTHDAAVARRVAALQAAVRTRDRARSQQGRH